jgi:transcription termination factor Rho
MSETQLERSVLEAKERDELFAIADALGASPGARAKKSDLIDQILRATGIEPDAASESEPEKPRRTRARKAAVKPAEPGEPSLPANGSDLGAEPAAEESGAGDAAAPDGGVSRARNGSSDGPAGQTDVTAGANGSTGDPDSEAVTAGSKAADSPRGSGRRAPASGADRGPSSGRSETGGRSQSGGRRETGGRGETDGLSGDGADPATGEVDNGTQSGAVSTGFGAEPGNRRNRRRRGRDRFDRPERDLPGQSVESQYNGEPIPVTGYLDLKDEGYGFLRTSGFLSGPGDVYVSISQVRRFALRKGDFLEGAARPAGGNEKYPALLRIDTVSGLTPDDARGRPRFENLTPLFPDAKLRLEIPGDSANLTARIVDLISPIGKGQRGMIVSPPKAGKTTILKQIAHSIEANNPGVQLMVLLVDERPEEVTDMRRSVKGEVIASTFDRPAEEHTQVAELAIERAKRMVEMGKDVVIVLDGITRLARAYNLAQPATGRIMSGGIDTGALYPPKKFFGAARNIEEGGSLTILATALVETGSRMDEVIFEEFKGTGNMELRLDRRLAERRIYPAIDVNGSSTRHEELLFDRVQLQQVWKLRRVLNALASEGSGAAGLELLLDRIKSTRTNDEFLAEVAKNATPVI